MPILGIIASSFRSAAGPVGAYDSLATVTLSASTSTVTFAGIPSGYKHLQLRMLLRDNRATTDNASQITFNSDTGANYSYHYLAGNGSTASAGSGTSLNFIYTFQPSANATASAFGANILDILDYSNTNKYKTTRELEGEDFNGSGSINFISGSWRSTSAITSITLTAGSSASYIANSSFALYGVK